MKKNHDNCSLECSDCGGCLNCGCECQSHKPYADMADICELAHILTEKMCFIKDIELEYQTKTGDVQYNKESQAIFDMYYELITNTLNI